MILSSFVGPAFALMPWWLGLPILAIGIVYLLTQYSDLIKEEESRVSRRKAMVRIPFAYRKRAQWKMETMSSKLLAQGRRLAAVCSQYLPLSKHSKNFALYCRDCGSIVRGGQNRPKHNLSKSKYFHDQVRRNARDRAARRLIKRSLFLVTAGTVGFISSVTGATNHSYAESHGHARSSEPDMLSFLVASTLVAHSSSKVDDEDQVHGQFWDSDSAVVGVDDRCSACISDHEADFVPGTLVAVNRTIKGFAGSRTSKGIKMGTLRWKVLDDKGREHTWEIPGSYYVPDAGMRLFSPQHWSQTRPRQDQVAGKWASHSVSRDTADLKWNRRKDSLNLIFDKRSNVFNFHLAPGYDRFKAFVAEAGLEDEDDDPVV
ncbi:MAG: hypothetical protein ACRCT2_05385, partial [Plesiomonas shigelloides]